MRIRSVPAPRRDRATKPVCPYEGRECVFTCQRCHPPVRELDAQLAYQPRETWYRAEESGGTLG